MGELIFAKWVLTLAAVLGPGVGLDLPIMAQVTPESPAVFDIVAQPAPVPVPCPPVPPGVVAPPCVPAPPTIAAWQNFCAAAPGVYTVTLRLGLLAPWGTAGGKIWLEGGGAQSLVAAFTAAPGSPAYVAGSLQVPISGETCFRLRLEASAPVETIGDPRVSFVTIGR